MRENSALCLSTGALQFWIVDPKRETVTVAARNGSTTMYQKTDAIPLVEFGADHLAVSEIFE
jgi:Uma2 family endonuclease